MLSRNAAGDCQTEAASLRGWVESDEAFEDSFPVGVRDSRAVVGDVHDDVVLGAPESRTIAIFVSNAQDQPRPMNGIFVAITVMNWTFASSGNPAM